MNKTTTIQTRENGGEIGMERRRQRRKLKQRYSKKKESKLNRLYLKWFENVRVEVKMMNGSSKWMNELHWMGIKTCNFGGYDIHFLHAMMYLMPICHVVFVHIHYTCIRMYVRFSSVRIRHFGIESNANEWMNECITTTIMTTMLLSVVYDGDGDGDNK